MSKEKLVLGRIINPISDKKTQYFPEGAMLLVKSSGGYRIAKIGDKKRFKNFTGEVLDYSSRVILPSFFDMHFHWVQDDVREMPKDSLLEWLEKYTFPTEAKYKSKKYSEAKAKKFFKRLAKTGTLGGACFSSVHEHALEHAFKYQIGDFVIGNVLMTINSPKSLLQSKKEALTSVKNGIKKFGNKYAVTPRFAIATDPETMEKSHELARKNKNFIQSHLSENLDEIDFVTGLLS